MSYGDFKDLSRKTFDGKVLRDKAFNIAKDSVYGGYQHGVASMANTFFDKKKTSGSVIKNEKICYRELTEELHKPIIRKLLIIRNLK